MKRFNKNVNLFIGLIGGFLLFLGLNSFFIFSDIGVDSRISLLSIFANGLFALFIAFFVQKYLVDRSSLKDYFINEIGMKQTKYSDFIDSMKRGELSSDQILQDFKSFSVGFFQLDVFLKLEMDISTMQIQKSNREIQQIVTSSSEFNEQYQNTKVVLSSEVIKHLSSTYKTFNYFCTDIIIKINKQ